MRGEHTPKILLAVVEILAKGAHTEGHYRLSKAYSMLSCQRKSLSSPAQPLTNNMRTTIGLLIVSVIAEAIAIFGTPPEFRVFAAAVLVPAIILNVLFIVYGRRRMVWSYWGAMVVGIVLMLIQVGISVNPVGSGPPAGITALFIVLPALVSLKSYESILELRK